MKNPWRISKIYLVQSDRENKVYLYSLKRMAKQCYEIRSPNLIGETHYTLEAAQKALPLYVAKKLAKDPSLYIMINSPA